MKSRLTKLAGIAVAAALLPTMSMADPTWDVKDGSPDMPFNFAASPEKAAMLEGSTDAEQGRVLNGKISEDGAWPWQVALMRVDVEKSVLSQFCGGSMIQKDWVLTAAHCVVEKRDDGYYIIDPATTRIMVGTNRISNEGDFVEVSQIVVHEGYDPNGFDNDIALIKLGRVPNASFKTITIPTAEYADVLERPDTKTIVTGWGRTEAGTPSRELREGEIKIIDRNICNAAIMAGPVKAAAGYFQQAANALSLSGDDANAMWDELMSHVPTPLTENMICSGTPEGPRGACDGDSGGPLVVPVGDGKFIQAGIVSWGLASADGVGCNRDAKFSAYTRTGNYADWVLTKLGYK
ncbi:serine protease [Oricola sp.]|uniref:S1 family serine peptidase n=1 Tax=Oricola sp. TaxID=1979950 RepID=UPI0025E233B9|nr:serine protease [Oricola sp.]MCI5078567.1 serine protease [Oricola sp.]